MAIEIITIIKTKNGIVQEAKSFIESDKAELFFRQEVTKIEPSISDEDMEVCLDNGYYDNNSGEDDVYIVHNELIATEVEPVAGVYEVKASTLSQDIISIIEGIIDLTPVDPAEFTWLLKMKTLTETLDDDGLEDGYEDAFNKEEWTAFVKDCESSGAKYVLIDGSK